MGGNCSSNTKKQKNEVEFMEINFEKEKTLNEVILLIEGLKEVGAIPDFEGFKRIIFTNKGVQIMV